MPTFNAIATPVQVVPHDGYTTTRFELFANGNEYGTVTVDNPGDLSLALRDWARSLTLPTLTRRGEPSNTNAWMVSISKPARWPSGYKQAGERTHTFVVGRPLFEVLAETEVTVCPECERAFDLTDVYDADEWYNGHDCEVQ